MYRLLMTVQVEEDSSTNPDFNWSQEHKVTSV